jgi:uncharacterized protein (TIGR01319 family)
MRRNKMQIDVLVAEIGSTTTVANGFCLGEKAGFIARGIAPTTVNQGDVTIGLSAAVKDMTVGLGVDKLEYGEMMASSSAAGGLRMSVHGLVYDMTARAAREAALGAGAVVKYITAGNIDENQLQDLEKIQPNIILLAGGVDYGDKETAIHNAGMLARVAGDVPVIFAGNVAARPEIEIIFRERGVKYSLVDNVYPQIDRLEVEPARKVIQKVFEEHIVKAPGMERIREMVKGPIMPTPGAVMEACKVLWPIAGDLCAVDVGGATTDVHSVAGGNPEIQDILESPEPFAKRTVEGDLGIYINARNVYSQAGEKAVWELGFDPADIIRDMPVIPVTDRQKKVVSYLTRVACEIAFSRHAGRFRYLYGPTGRQTVATGKDLSSVNTIIGTGGPLTQIAGGTDILLRLIGQGPGRELYPKHAQVLIDSQYIMASCGLLSKKYPKEAEKILINSLRIEP